MTDQPRSPFARLGRALGSLLPGARERRAQTEAYASAWDAHNATAMRANGPLWVALGDSTAQGIGASAHDRGYVGQLLGLLRTERDPAYRVVNLSRTGALTDDVLDRQLPALATIEQPVALVTCGIGSNDVLRRPKRLIVERFERLVAELPTGTVLANIPQGLGSGRTRAANALLAERAPAHGVIVADVHAHTGAPWTAKYAPDRFHPNDRGYQEWVAAFAAALEIDR